jgi:hypothetical protein
MATTAQTRAQKIYKDAQQDYNSQKELAKKEELSSYYMSKISSLQHDAIGALNANFYDMAINRINEIKSYHEKLNSL